MTLTLLSKTVFHCGCKIFQGYPPLRVVFFMLNRLTNKSMRSHLWGFGLRIGGLVQISVRIDVKMQNKNNPIPIFEGTYMSRTCWLILFRGQPSNVSRGLADLSVARIFNRRMQILLYIFMLYIYFPLSNPRDIDLKIISNILRTHVILEFIRLYNPLINLHIYIYIPQDPCMPYMVTFTYIYHQHTPNVSIYTIHGSYGI